MICRKRGSSKDKIKRNEERIWNKQKLRVENINQSLRTALPSDDAGCYNKTNFS
jgi:LPS O-antigen subunit length determinant protein (WzzB/FepE family)